MRYLRISTVSRMSAGHSCGSRGSSDSMRNGASDSTMSTSSRSRDAIAYPILSSKTRRSLSPFSLARTVSMCADP